MDHDFYLWMSYGVTALAIVGGARGCWRMRARRARCARIEEERELEAQD